MTRESSGTSQGATSRQGSFRVAFEEKKASSDPPKRVGSPRTLRHGRRSSKGPSATPEHSINYGPRHASTTSSHGSSNNENQRLASGGATNLKSVASKTSTRSLPDFRNGGREFRPKLYWPTTPPFASEVTFDPRQDYPSEIYIGDPISSLVGKSDKSIVYAGLFHDHNGQDEWLAVKSILCHRESARDSLMSAHQEYELLKKLEHNHVIAVVGAYRDSSVEPETWAILLYPLAPYDLIEYMGELSEHNHRRLNFEDWHPSDRSNLLLSFLPCLCRAVSYLHSKLIKHRDIKPGNILIDRFGTVILTDLDIAKQYRSLQNASTDTRGLCTYQYAPAQVSNGEPLGLSRDINSLGFVFLEMATVIFGETNENMFHHLTKGDKCPSCWKPELFGICPQSRIDATDDKGVAANAKPKTLFYSKALEKKLIARWVNHLKEIPHQHPKQIPDAFHSADGLCTKWTDELLDMIVAMMEEPHRAQHTLLRNVWQLFDKLNIPGGKCKHCHPDMTKYGLDDPATDDHAQAGREDTSSIVKSSAHSPSSGLGIPLPTPTSAPFAPGISKKSISGTAVPFRDSPLTEDDESIHSSRNTKRPEVRNGGDNSSSPVPRINVRSPTGFRETEEPTNLLACNGVTTSSGRLESDDEGSAEPNGHDLHIADDERKIPSNGTVPVTHHTLTSRPLGDGERNAEDIVPADPLSHKPVLRAWSYRNGAWYSKAINDIKTSKIIVYAPIDELIEVKHKSYMKDKEGALIRLPRRNRALIAIPKGELLNLKDRLGIWDNLKWKMNLLQWLFVTGTFRLEDVEFDLFTPQPSIAHNS